MSLYASIKDYQYQISVAHHTRYCHFGPPVTKFPTTWLHNARAIWVIFLLMSLETMVGIRQLGAQQTTPIGDKQHIYMYIHFVADCFKLKRSTKEILPIWQHSWGNQWYRGSGGLGGLPHPHISINIIAWRAHFAQLPLLVQIRPIHGRQLYIWVWDLSILLLALTITSRQNTSDQPNKINCSAAIPVGKCRKVKSSWSLITNIGLPQLPHRFIRPSDDL